MPPNTLTHLIGFIGLIAICSSLIAQSNEAPAAGPPTEAFAACKDQPADSVCSYEAAGDRTQGLCMSIRGWELHCTAPHRIAPEKTSPKPTQQSTAKS